MSRMAVIELTTTAGMTQAGRKAVASSAERVTRLDIGASRRVFGRVTVNANG